MVKHPHFRRLIRCLYRHRLGVHSMLDQCTKCILVPLDIKFTSNASNPLVVKAYGASVYAALVSLEGFPTNVPFRTSHDVTAIVQRRPQHPFFI